MSTSSPSSCSLATSLDTRSGISGCVGENVSRWCLDYVLEVVSERDLKITSIAKSRTATRTSCFVFSDTVSQICTIACIALASGVSFNSESEKIISSPSGVSANPACACSGISGSVGGHPYLVSVCDHVGNVLIGLCGSRGAVKASRSGRLSLRTGVRLHR